MRIYQIVLLNLLFVLQSCTENPHKSAYSERVNRDEVIGNWGLTEESSRILKNKSTELPEIENIELKSDAFADIYFSNGDKFKGNWFWKVENNIDDKNTGISFNSNVEITYKNNKDKFEMLLFELNPPDGLMLNLDKDIYYEKK